MKKTTAPLAVYQGTVGRIDNDALIIHSFGHRSWPYQHIDALYIHTRRLPFLRALGVGCLASVLGIKFGITVSMPWPYMLLFVIMTTGIIPLLFYYRKSRNYLVLKGKSMTCRWEIPPRLLNECRLYRQIARQMLSHQNQCEVYGKHRHLIQPWFLN